MNLELRFKFKIVEDLSTTSNNDKYYRIEVIDDNENIIGGLFRGLNNLINNLYNDDNPFYDNLNEPLSRLEYETTFPKNFDRKEAIFAYKEEKFNQLKELILDLKYELNELGWDLTIKEIDRPSNIIYEDDEQIAYLRELNEKKNKATQKSKIKKLIWYRMPSGKMPAKEFYENSSKQMRFYFDILFENLQSNKLSNIKDAGKLLDSKERIFELRVKDQDHWARITFARVDDGTLLLLGFNKTQNKTDPIEIKKSINYKKDYLNRRDGEEVIL